MIGPLKRKFASPKAAEAHYLQPSPSSEVAVSELVANIPVAVQTDTSSICHVDCQTQLSWPPLCEDKDLVVFSSSFSQHLWATKGIFLPDDYLLHSASAMVQLSNSNRSNVVYNLVKGIGSLRTDGSDSCFPCKRMPMGLLEYMADFFSSDSVQQVCMHVKYLAGMKYTREFILGQAVP